MIYIELILKFRKLHYWKFDQIPLTYMSVTSGVNMIRKYISIFIKNNPDTYCVYLGQMSYIAFLMQLRQCQQ